ncbi:hemerythrin domain-containing protein [Mariniflexile sp.]|uniref:hemerythrin domain-containing protein n=1 Tax=Mariniflexile sp. TaxID=1979402 RepID=UPI0035696760
MNSFSPVVEKLPEGHPVKVYYEESALIQDLISELNDVNPAEDFQKYFKIFNQLKNIEKRFERIENQLFPYLEKRGWEGPTECLWSFHDNLRAQIKLLSTYNSEKNIAKIQDNIPYLTKGIERLLTMEDTRLFPNSMEVITDEDWKLLCIGDEEFGFMLEEEPKRYSSSSFKNSSKRALSLS